MCRETMIFFLLRTYSLLVFALFFAFEETGSCFECLPSFYCLAFFISGKRRQHCFFGKVLQRSFQKLIGAAGTLKLCSYYPGNDQSNQQSSYFVYIAATWTSSPFFEYYRPFSHSLPLYFLNCCCTAQKVSPGFGSGNCFLNCSTVCFSSCLSVFK